MKYLAIGLLAISSIVFGHAGGLDKNGGHKDRNSGGYHCHKEPCISQHKKSNDALQEAMTQGRKFSLVYNRSEWRHWSDFDNDCVNTRHEILKAQADGPIKLSQNGCSVLTGLWDDPFSGRRFTRASDLDVDHVIPLKWANDHGGAVWTERLKEQFANDPENLLAVDDGLNQEKGAKGPTEWLPPNQRFRCEYLALWEFLLSKYPTLKMTNAEKRIFTRQLSACRT